MAAELNTISVLSDPVTARVFREVLENRRLRFGELIARTGTIDREQTRVALRQLTDAHLVAQKGSVVEDFTTYYVTAEGLEAGRRHDV